MKENENNHNGYINEYLKRAFEALGKKQSEIISEIDKPQPYVSALMNGKKKVGKEIAQLLSDLYGFDKGRILTGEGEMLSENSDNEINSARKTYDSGRPFYNVDWELGFKESYDESPVNPDFNIDFPPANKTSGQWMRGRGKSMLGEIDPGDYIYFSELEDFSWFPFGRVYGVVTKNNMRTVKRIVQSETAGHYKLISSNPDKVNYPDQDIPAEMVKQLYEVKFVIKNLDE